MFVKYPSFFENTSEELLNCANKVYKKKNLRENLEKFKTLVNSWKQANIIEITDEIQSMKIQTSVSKLETSDENCKNCFDNQNKILDVALEYFQKQTPPS